MRRGAVAMFDALGFKGIWQRFDPDNVLEKLVALRDVVANQANLTNVLNVERAARWGSAVSLEAVFLSDTVVIAVSSQGPIRSTDPEEELPESLGHHLADLAVLSHAITAASMIQMQAALRPPSLAYRGCIAIGDFDLRGPFLVGPAVDEAAGGMDRRIEAAIVWLAPSATALFRDFSDHVASSLPGGSSQDWHWELPELVRGYEVPDKGGQSFVADAVSPLAHAHFAGGGSDEVKRAIMKTFTAGHESKQRNTGAFLDHAMELAPCDGSCVVVPRE